MEVGVERVLRARGLALTDRGDRAVVPAARDPVEVGAARLARDEEQRVERLTAQVGDRAHPELVEPRGRHRTDAPERPHGQVEQERVLVVGPDDPDAARLRGLRGELRDELDRPSPSETGRPLSSRARSRIPVASASRSVSGPTAAATSANASSMLTGSTRSVTSRSAAMMRAE